MRQTYIEIAGMRYSGGLTETDLSPYRLQKAQKQKTEHGRWECLAAGICLDVCLKRMGLREKDMVYRTGPYGKPEFVHYPDIHFSISHSHGLVLAGISDVEIGIDVEQIHEAKLGVARHFFTTEEYERLLTLEDEEQKRTFYRVWTAKESYMKLTGLGMRLEMNQFSCMDDGIILSERAVELLRTEHVPRSALQAHLQRLDDGQDYEAVCCMAKAADESFAVERDDIFVRW